MAESHIRIEHLLVFAGEEERQHYLSAERTEAERNEIRAELEEVYRSIPDPTDAELRQFIGDNTWTETEYNLSARDLSRAQWKSFRKAAARTELEKRKAKLPANSEPPKKYRPSPEQFRQLCRSRNESEAEVRAFLESDTRDAKDMLAYLEYEGGQVPPDDPPREGEFRDIQPSQISSDKKHPGVFDDINPLGKSDLSKDEKARATAYEINWGDQPSRPPEVDWTQTKKPGIALSALRDEVDRASKVMGEAAELLRRKTPKPPSGESAAPQGDPFAKTVRELVDESSIASQPLFTVLDDAGPFSRLSRLLNKIPVWKEFGAWLKWASACFAFAATMTQIGEYGWALLGLVLCGLCCITQIAVWTVSPSIYKNAVVKGLLAVVSVGLIVMAALTLIRIKGEKPWSVWQASRAAASPTPTTVSSFSSPFPTASTIPVLSTPSPSTSQIATSPGTITPESAQFDLEGGKRYNVLVMFRLQEKYRGPGSVLQFEVIVINSGELYAGGANVSDKTGLPIDQSRYWQQVDIRDLYFYMPHSGRVAVTFVWLKPLVLTPSP